VMRAEGIKSIAVRVRCISREGEQLRFGVKFDVVDDELRIHSIGLEKFINELRRCVDVETEEVWG